VKRTLRVLIMVGLLATAAVPASAASGSRGNDRSDRVESRITLTEVGGSGYEGKAKLKFESANDDGPDQAERSLSVEVDGPNGTLDIILNGVDVGDITVVRGTGNFDLDDAVTVVVSGSTVDVRTQGAGATTVLTGTF